MGLTYRDIFELLCSYLRGHKPFENIDDETEFLLVSELSDSNYDINSRIFIDKTNNHLINNPRRELNINHFKIGLISKLTISIF